MLQVFWLLRAAAKLAGVQGGVAVILVSCSMEFIGAGLGRDHDVRGGSRSILRLVVRGEHLEFADHIRCHAEVPERDHSGLAHRALLHADAVHDRFVPGLQAAVDAGAEGVVSTARRDSRQENGKLGGISRRAAYDQGELVYRLGRNPLLPRSAVEVQRRGIPFDRDSLFHSTQLHLYIHANLLVQRQRNAFLAEGAEAGNTGRKFVCAGDQVRESIQTVGAGSGARRDACADVLYRDFRAWYHRAVRVDNRAADSAPELRQTRPERENEQKQWH